MLKQIQVKLYPPERPHWHGDIKKHWRSSGVFIVNFEKISFFFLLFHCWIWGSVSRCIYQQSTDNVCRWMQIAGFEQTLRNLLRLLFHKNNFFIGKKLVETTTEAINDTSDVLCFDLYLENLRRHRDAQTLCSNGHLIVYLLVLKI